MIAEVAAEPLWTRELVPPLCSIPWLGRFVVLSAGHANFCCYSSAVVGNVNDTPLDQIWRGPHMQHVRSELAAGRLPKECQSTSCPIYRGDDRNYLREASGTVKASWPDDCRVGFDGVPERVAVGSALALDLWIEGAHFHGRRADLFVAVQRPDGSYVFQPEATPFATPLATWVTVGGRDARWTHRAVAHTIETPGRYRLCAALIQPGADPNDRTQCHGAFVIEIAAA